MIYHFIVNPRARSGLGEMLWKQLEPELCRKRIDYQIHLTTKKKDAGKIASEITEDGQEHMFVVLGGDGTLNEVLSGIKSLEKVTLGYIPIGSSNDFARGTGIPGDPFEALDTILSPKKVEKMDIGVLKRGGKGRRFAVSAGIGFDAAVCHEVCVSKWKRVLNLLKIGKLSYAVVAMDRIIKDRPVKLELTMDDGSTKVFEKTYFAAFMNLPYEGGGFKFCPEASGSDGFLDIIQVKFTDIVNNGRSINVDFSFEQTATISMSTEIGNDGLTLSDQLELWMSEHAYKNNYHIQGTTDKRMIFDDVRIPLKDDNGNNYNINKFGLEFLKFARSIGLQITRSTANNTLVITFK